VLISRYVAQVIEPVSPLGAFVVGDSPAVAEELDDDALPLELGAALPQPVAARAASATAAAPARGHRFLWVLRRGGWRDAR
jgi:hypothetical protein